MPLNCKDRNMVKLLPDKRNGLQRRENFWAVLIELFCGSKSVYCRIYLCVISTWQVGLKTTLWASGYGSCRPGSIACVNIPSLHSRMSFSIFLIALMTRLLYHEMLILVIRMWQLSTICWHWIVKKIILKLRNSWSISVISIYLSEWQTFFQFLGMTVNVLQFTQINVTWADW